MFSSRKLHHRRRRQSASAARRRVAADVISSTPHDVSISSPAFMVAAPVMLSPPSYVELEGTCTDSQRPPSYCQCLSNDTPMSGDGGVQLYGVDDLPAPISSLVQPTAPPTPDDHLTSTVSCTSTTTTTTTGIILTAGLTDERQVPVDYRNPALSDSGV